MPLLATTPGNRLTISRISTAGAAPLPSRIVMVSLSACSLSPLDRRRWLGGWVAGSSIPRALSPCHPATSVLRGRRGNRFERDRLEGSQLFLVRRHRDRAVDDRLLVGGNGVDHVLRHRLVQVTET